MFLNNKTPSSIFRLPSWEVLVILSQYLDPKTLALASCVSKSWSDSMSSDHLWKPIFTSHFPSLSTLQLTNPTVPYRRLFAIGRAAAKRRQQTPSKPHISLDNLIFAVTISTTKSHVVTVAKPGDELLVDPHNGVFRFDVDVREESGLVNEGLKEVKISWNVIIKGWRGVFTMMDCDGTMSFAAGAEGWFSEELPMPGCCSNAGATGIVADLKLGLSDGKQNYRDGKVRVNKLSVGILSIVDWRYVSVEDGLRYLQHFLV
ncbi:F-box protein [Quillaja saponaria]|uniref:F-box protein n=1 Tax=Quillaja saponaria TaxID=32244 RepID=A0AAD7VI70_QUISA|nr:F-box protein [Quillaja saponaria]